MDVPLPPGFEDYKAAGSREPGSAEDTKWTSQGTWGSHWGESSRWGQADSANSTEASWKWGSDSYSPAVSSTTPVAVAAASSEKQDRDEESEMLDSTKKFEDFRLSPELLEGLYNMGFVMPSKIQASSLEFICKQEDGSPGKNMIGQAQNGSGKTVTFSLALLTAIDVAVRRPQAVVVCHTRELARQNEEVIKSLGKLMNVETQLIVPKAPTPEWGQQGHVLIGTPGKYCELLKKMIIDVDEVKVLVLDEADVMLDQDMDMGPQVTQLRKFLPKKLQILFFSATYPDTVRKFAEKLVPDSFRVQVKKTDLTLSTVSQCYWKCQTDWDKYTAVVELFASLNVAQCIVFVNNRRKAFELARWLKEESALKLPVTLICGTQRDGEERMDERTRDKVMQEFRDGVTKVLVATDVLSRGIDVPAVTLVINYDLPIQYGGRGDARAVAMETYLHRVGRTGRFGLRGVAVNLVVEAEVELLETIRNEFACQIDEVRDSEQCAALLEATGAAAPGSPA